MTDNKSVSQIANPYQPETARIVRNKPLAKNVELFQVRPLATEEKFFNYLPGQFMEVSIPGAGEAPFSISSSPTRRGLIEFCIRKVGTVTEAIFNLSDGDTIGLRGPYGNGFPMDDLVNKDLLFVAGGLGMAPLRSLFLYCLDKRHEFGDINFLHGAKEPEEMLFKDEFLSLKKRADLKCFATVDKDETGQWSEDIGVVTELFSKKCIQNIQPENTYAIICGPPVMYKFVIKELVDLEIPEDQILMTLERRMKCGVGKCGHCAVDHLYVCREGPVFSYWDVKDKKELI